MFRILLTDQAYAAHGYEAYLNPAHVAMVMVGTTHHTIIMVWGQRFFVPLAEEPTLMELVTAVRRVSGGPVAGTTSVGGGRPCRTLA